MKKIIFICLLCLLTLAVVCSCAADGGTAGTDSTDTVQGGTEDDTDKQTQQDGEDMISQNQNADYVINSFYDLNKNSNTELSHDADGTYANLELDYRSVQHLDYKLLKTMTVYYPRLKHMADGSYILFYQEGEHGDTVYYTRSSDLENWDEPRMLFIHEESKDIKYATCDAVVLDNGEILAACSYREGSTYDINPQLNGIAMKKSADNGETWSEQKVIYVGTTWEPYPLQLSSGEVQVYFTNTTCYYRSPAADASTGTALVRSYDRGDSWTADLSVPYSAQIVSQTATRVSSGVQRYSDQMPSAIELLGSKKIMLALETRLNKSGSYKISFSYSADNWAQPLGKDEEGPSEKISKAWTGAAPYLCQFVSGEIVSAYTRQNYLTYRMISSDGKSYTSEEFMPFKDISKSYWGSLEIINSHTVVGIGETFNKVTVTRTENTVDYGKLNLNHSISAKRMTPVIDGDASDWSDNDEAVFIGSVSQAQASVRSAHDTENVYFLIERLDSYLDSEADTVSLYFESKDSAGYYRLTVGIGGIVQFEYYDGKKFNELDTSRLSCGLKINGTPDYDEDTDVGYSAELMIPVSEIGGVRSELSLYISLANTDMKEKSDRDTLTGAKLEDKSTWINVKYE